MQNLSLTHPGYTLKQAIDKVFIYSNQARSNWVY